MKINHLVLSTSECGPIEQFTLAQPGWKTIQHVCALTWAVFLRAQHDLPRERKEMHT